MGPVQKTDKGAKLRHVTGAVRGRTAALFSLLVFLNFASAAREPRPEASYTDRAIGIEIARKWTRNAPGPSERVIPIDLRRDTRLYLFFDEEMGPSIAKRGFLNQHQTGASGGELDPELRARLENIFAAGPVGTATGLLRPSISNRVRPKYLMVEIIPDLWVGVAPEADDLLQYGHAIAVLKDEVKSRTTFLYDDSLDSYGRMLLNGEVPPFVDLQSFYQNALLGPRDNRISKYIEGQVWGALEASDIDHLMMYHDFADDRHLAPLKALNVPIYAYRIIDDDDLRSRVKRGQLLWAPPGEMAKPLDRNAGSLAMECLKGQLRTE